jgi:hypothetical protein
MERLLSNAMAKSSSKQNYTSLSAIQSSTANSQHIDIFLSNVWPTAISRLSSVPLPDPQLASSGAPPLDEVIPKIQPRYHFAAAGGSPPKFWEREPFVWDGEEARVTRFVSLGGFGNEAGAGKKQRVHQLLKPDFYMLTFRTSGSMRSVSLRRCRPPLQFNGLPMQRKIHLPLGLYDKSTNDR